MGDMADYFDDTGMEALWAHQRGECDYGCEYCVEEEAEAEREANHERRLKRSRDFRGEQ